MKLFGCTKITKQILISYWKMTQHRGDKEILALKTLPETDFSRIKLEFFCYTWPQGSKAFRICQTLRVFISKMSIRDRRTKKAVHRPASGLAPTLLRATDGIAEGVLQKLF